MSIRQIVLDTETTGLRVEEGHRIIEIACVEMINRKLTGQYFHHYFNPECAVEAGALAVHGITNSFLQDKPIFKALVKEFLDFIKGAELIIHNAPFDIAFLNNELSLIPHELKSLETYCAIFDTLPLARSRHVGQRNSLDALCKRYGVDNSKRDLHGALLDANLLAQVYLAMTGGQGSFFDHLNEKDASALHPQSNQSLNLSLQQHDLIVLKANSDDVQAHEKYLQQMKQQGKCLWLEDSL